MIINRRSETGSVAIIAGATIAVLFGLLGLSVDLGRMFVIKSEIQTGMDACALAAASQLRPGLNDPAALDRATAFGRTPTNRANFQGADIDPNAIQLAFAADLAGPYVANAGGGGGLANTARYVRCTYPMDDVPVYFMRVLNAMRQTTVAATAVATLMPSQHSCGFPVAVCRAAGTGAPDWGLTPGQWVSGLGSAGGGGGGGGGTGPAGCTAGTGTGNFCWIDFSPPAGGASELSTLIKGQGQCQTAVPNPIGQTGAVASLVDAWNTRFGIYKQNQIAQGAAGELGTAPPDRTGYAYTAANWPSQFNAYPDYAGAGGKRATYAPFNPGGSGIAVPGGDLALTSAQHQQFGRDRRLVLAPIVNCSGFTSSQTVPMDAWACMMLLAPISNPGGGAFSARLEYLGLANAPGSPCATSGLAGGTAGPLVPVLVQ